MKTHVAGEQALSMLIDDYKTLDTPFSVALAFTASCAMKHPNLRVNEQRGNPLRTAGLSKCDHAADPFSQVEAAIRAEDRKNSATWSSWRGRTTLLRSRPSLRSCGMKERRQRPA